MIPGFPFPQHGGCIAPSLPPAFHSLRGEKDELTAVQLEAGETLSRWRCIPSKWLRSHSQLVDEAFVYILVTCHQMKTN